MGAWPKLGQWAQSCSIWNPWLCGSLRSCRLETYRPPFWEEREGNRVALMSKELFLIVSEAHVPMNYVTRAVHEIMLNTSIDFLSLRLVEFGFLAHALKRLVTKLYLFGFITHCTPPCTFCSTHSKLLSVPLKKYTRIFTCLCPLPNCYFSSELFFVLSKSFVSSRLKSNTTYWPKPSQSHTS